MASISAGTWVAWRAQAPTAPPGRMEMAFGLVQVGLAAAALGDARSALTCAQWLAIDRMVVAQIRRRKDSAGLGHGTHERLGNWTLVERVGAFVS